jgi:hypothetical protein
LGPKKVAKLVQNMSFIAVLHRNRSQDCHYFCFFSFTKVVFYSFITKYVNKSQKLINFEDKMLRKYFKWGSYIGIEHIGMVQM